jgi:hypothetical protein
MTPNCYIFPACKKTIGIVEKKDRINPPCVRERLDWKMYDFRFNIDL